MVMSPFYFIVMVMSSYNLKILERDDGQQKTNSHYLISPNNSHLSFNQECVLLNLHEINPYSGSGDKVVNFVILMRFFI